MTDIWRTVHFSLGANDKYGSCVFVCLANLLDLWAAMDSRPFTIGDGEALHWYAVETGFNSQDHGTDKGAVLEAVIQHWCENGAPADPLNKPFGYRAIGSDEVDAAIGRNAGVPCWAMLPASEGFGNDTLAEEPTWPHAMLIVSATTYGLALVTWGRAVSVSWAWWERFGRGQFEVERPAT